MDEVATYGGPHAPMGTIMYGLSDGASPPPGAVQ